MKSQVFTPYTMTSFMPRICDSHIMDIWIYGHRNWAGSSQFFLFWWFQLSHLRII